MDHKYTADSDQWSIPYPSNDRDGRKTRGSSRSGDRGKGRSGDRGSKRSGDRGTSRNGDRGRCKGDDRGRSSSIDRGNRRSGDRSSRRSGDRGDKTKGDRGHSKGSREKNQPNHVPPPPYTLDVGMYDIFVCLFIHQKFSFSLIPKGSYRLKGHAMWTITL